MEQRKYLKWYHKVGYGTGDVAGNCVYALLTAFMEAMNQFKVSVPPSFNIVEP